VRLKKSELTENDIGFSLAPRVNAASRMDEPDLALSLLTTRDRHEAESLARELEELNTSRKGIVAGIVRAARKRVRERYVEADRIVVLGDTAWKPALLGLAANSIMGDRGGIVCLWGRDVNGNLKGSCRSDGAIGLPDLFAASRESFIECGGHIASGGFSVSHEKAHTLADDLARVAAALRADDVAPDAPRDEVAAYDAVVTLREISWPLLHEIGRLAPYGIGNPKPVFRVVGATITSMKQFGKEKNHVELMLECKESGVSIRAFDFFRSVDDFSRLPIVGEEAVVLATLERDTFRSPARLALRIVDVVSR
jgi:single-stranded-DNA-specific exonuclease